MPPPWIISVSIVVVLLGYAWWGLTEGIKITKRFPSERIRVICLSVLSAGVAIWTIAGLF